MGTRLFQIFTFLVTTQSWSQVVPLDESGKRAEVHLNVIDSFGNLLENPTVLVRRLVSGRAASTASARLHMDLEYGTYLFRLEQSGYSPNEQTVQINRDRISVTLCTALGSFEGLGVGSPIRGRIESNPAKSKCNFVRLTPLLCGSEPMTAEVDAAGRFEFQHVRAGKYIAVLLEIPGAAICSTTQLDVHAGASKEIRLPARRASPE